MPPVQGGAAQTLGEIVRRYRDERGLTLSQLAAKAKVSKSYISAIEHGEGPRPSGNTLYAIAEALGVTMSDLLGRRLLPAAARDRPASLEEFAREYDLPEADVEMLASINFRGERPQTKQRWAHIYSAIRETKWMDRSEHARDLP
jgi:transcriptional regulator with XRE-family HTH domain